MADDTLEWKLKLDTSDLQMSANQAALQSQQVALSPLIQSQMYASAIQAANSQQNGLAPQQATLMQRMGGLFSGSYMAMNSTMGDLSNRMAIGNPSVTPYPRGYLPDYNPFHRDSFTGNLSSLIRWEMMRLGNTNLGESLGFKGLGMSKELGRLDIPLQRMYQMRAEERAEKGEEFRMDAARTGLNLAQGASLVGGMMAATPLGIGVGLAADIGLGYYEQTRLKPYEDYMALSKYMREASATTMRGRPFGGASYKQMDNFQQGLAKQVSEDKFFTRDDYANLTQLSFSSGLQEFSNNEGKILGVINNLQRNLKTLYSVGVKLSETNSTVNLLTSMGIDLGGNQRNVARQMGVMGLSAYSAGLSFNDLLQQSAQYGQSFSQFGIAPQIGMQSHALNAAYAGEAIRMGGFNRADLSYYGGREGIAGSLTRGNQLLSGSTAGTASIMGAMSDINFRNKFNSGTASYGDLFRNPLSPEEYLRMDYRYPEYTKDMNPESFGLSQLSTLVKTLRDITGDKVGPEVLSKVLQGPGFGLGKDDARLMARQLENSGKAARGAKESIRDKALTFIGEQNRPAPNLLTKEGWKNLIESYYDQSASSWVSGSLGRISSSEHHLLGQLDKTGFFSTTEGSKDMSLPALEYLNSNSNKEGKFDIKTSSELGKDLEKDLTRTRLKRASEALKIKTNYLDNSGEIEAYGSSDIGESANSLYKKAFLSFREQQESYYKELLSGTTTKKREYGPRDEESLNTFNTVLKTGILTEDSFSKLKQEYDKGMFSKTEMMGLVEKSRNRLQTNALLSADETVRGSEGLRGRFLNDFNKASSSEEVDKFLALSSNEKINSLFERSVEEMERDRSGLGPILSLASQALGRKIDDKEYSKLSGEDKLKVAQYSKGILTSPSLSSRNKKKSSKILDDLNIKATNSSDVYQNLKDEENSNMEKLRSHLQNAFGFSMSGDLSAQEVGYMGVQSQLQLVEQGIEGIEQSGDDASDLKKQRDELLAQKEKLYTPEMSKLDKIFKGLKKEPFRDISPDTVRKNMEIERKNLQKEVSSILNTKKKLDLSSKLGDKETREKYGEILSDLGVSYEYTDWFRKTLDTIDGSDSKENLGKIDSLFKGMGKLNNIAGLSDFARESISSHKIDYASRKGGEKEFGERLSKVMTQINPEAKVDSSFKKAAWEAYNSSDKTDFSTLLLKGGLSTAVDYGQGLGRGGKTLTGDGYVGEEGKKGIEDAVRDMKNHFQLLTNISQDMKTTALTLKEAAGVGREEGGIGSGGSAGWSTPDSAPPAGSPLKVLTEIREGITRLTSKEKSLGTDPTGYDIDNIARKNRSLGNNDINYTP